MCSQLEEYFISNYKLKFETERKNILKIELDKMQPIQKLEDDYIKLLKYNKNNKELCKDLEDVGNNVFYLDIIEIIQNFCNTYETHTERNRIITRCVYIHNKMFIFKIYTESEFNILFEDILPFYKEINKNRNNIAICYECVYKIIDILFIKAINCC